MRMLAGAATLAMGDHWPSDGVPSTYLRMHPPRCEAHQLQGLVLATITYHSED